MPRYDFECSECDRVFEVVAPDASERPCPMCGAASAWLPSVQVQPTFKPFVHPVMRGDVKIESREHYARECEKRGLIGPYNRP